MLSCHPNQNCQAAMLVPFAPKRGRVAFGFARERDMKRLGTTLSSTAENKAFFHLCGLPGKVGGAIYQGIGLCGLPGNATDTERHPDLPAPANHALYKAQS